MNEDFFSTVTKKATGFDLVFALTGLLWFIGTAVALNDIGIEALAVLIPLWISFATFLYFIKKLNIKSTTIRSIALFIGLHIWKVCLTVMISMIIA